MNLAMGVWIRKSMGINIVRPGNQMLTLSLLAKLSWKLSLF